MGKNRLIVALGRRSQVEVLGLGLLAAVLVAAADLATGAEMAFSFFYLIPVVGAAWFGSRGGAVAVALVAGAAFPISDHLAGEDPAAAWVLVWNFAVRSGTYLVVATLTAALRRALEHQRHLAGLDPLTGALNSRSFFEIGGHELARARRTRRPVTVAYIDLDGFKVVNDTYGHAAGDDVLQAFANCLSNGTRPTDVACRLGGDEFAILLAETGAEEALTPLQRIRDEVRSLAGRGGYALSVSVGAVTFLEPPESLDEALRAADALMYESKKHGKDRITSRVVETAPAPG